MARTTRRAANGAGEETRTRLLEATLTTLGELGLAKASSRPSPAGPASTRP
ncbi:MAG: hypothetical protein OEY41_13165 [Acidimicrobiia bacterium]|nr:hypothetical protein [Acidimicrobiia bacterium]MDH4364870.1 hypothetical protein [Acidimicrobiia bacterium]MDH5290940.1 hypothetical protein [Acidimicrobiia bacterium]